jgi:hypothetical protein
VAERRIEYSAEGWTSSSPESGEAALSLRSMLDVAADCTAVELAGLLAASRATRQGSRSMRRVDELHQAVGVIMHELGVSADEATTRLRAHVFQSDCSLDQVVSQLRDHSLRLTRACAPPRTTGGVNSSR